MISSTVAVVSFTADAVSEALEATWVAEARISPDEEARTFTPSWIASVWARRFSTMMARAFPMTSFSDWGATLTERSPAATRLVMFAISRMFVTMRRNVCASTPTSSILSTSEMVTSTSPDATRSAISVNSWSGDAMDLVSATVITKPNRKAPAPMIVKMIAEFFEFCSEWMIRCRACSASC